MTRLRVTVENHKSHNIWRAAHGNSTWLPAAQPLVEALGGGDALLGEALLQALRSVRHALRGAGLWQALVAADQVQSPHPAAYRQRRAQQLLAELQQHAAQLQAAAAGSSGAIGGGGGGGAAALQMA